MPTSHLVGSSTRVRRGPLPGVLAVAATLAGLNVRPAVTLDADEVLVPGNIDALLTSLRKQLGAGPDVLAANDQRVIRRFRGSAGRFRYATVELVQFERDAITFEHLRGPFVACHERFDLTPAAAGVRLRHTGTFTLRGGLWTWLFARTIVKRSFQDHVHKHLVALRQARRDPPGV